MKSTKLETFKLNNKWVTERLPKRPKDANKGTFGKVLVIAGSKNYPGAAYLCCAAAYGVGVGLVTLTTDKEVKIIVSRRLSEVTFLSYSEVFEKLTEYDVLLFGPGLGQKEDKEKLVEQLLKKNLPKTVIDGDGLNILSKIDKWWEKLPQVVVLTPHPGEMSRLTGLTIDQIQSERENVAKQFAKIWHQVLVLKGANTVVVSPSGEAMINPFANSLLATAGTGDVLAGVIVGLLAQGLKFFDAACVGVYLHGLAGELLRENFGDRGALASDLLPFLPQIIKQLSYIKS